MKIQRNYYLKYKSVNLFFTEEDLINLAGINFYGKLDLFTNIAMSTNRSQDVCVNIDQFMFNQLIGVLTK